MKYLSLFSGIGGFELGVGDRGECIGFSEIDKYATQIYQKHFPNHKAYGDITKIDTATLPDFDFLMGGFPCQSFSIAGKRGGFNDTRGTLFFEIARILKEKQPRLLLLENVKGLLSHDKGRTFFTIIATLDELGYDLQWQVLNSKNFGVPQNRERVFIVGHTRGTPRPKVFPITSDGKSFDELPRHISNTLTRRYEGAQAVGTYIGESELNAQEIKQINSPVHSNDRVYADTGISPTLNTMQGGLRQPKIYDLKASPNSTRRGVISQKGYSKTLDTDCLQGVEVQKRSLIRRLTPRECERLQGFPDFHTTWGKENGKRVKISDSQRYKCIGNAVTVNVIRAIVERIK